MPEISFICTIYNLDNENLDRLFGKFVTKYISDDNEGLDQEVENALRRCLQSFNGKLNAQLTINSIGILGVVENYFTTGKDREAFDVYIDYTTNKFYLYNEIIAFDL